MPAISLSEPFQKPTTMMYRNLLAMETEELLRSYPCDGAVLLGGCDKTTPALLMGAISMNIPTIFVPAGPMLRATGATPRSAAAATPGNTGPSCAPATDHEKDWQEIEEGIARSPGHCMTMGTASTLTSVAEVLGFTLPGAASIPATDSMHPRMAAGERPAHRRDGVGGPEAVRLPDGRQLRQCGDDGDGGRRLDQRHHPRHRHGRARRDTARPDALRRHLADDADDRQPAAVRRLPDGGFLLAGGLRALLKQLGDRLDLGCVTINGRTLGENIADAEIFDTDVIRTPETALSHEGGLAVISGTLAPDGAVIKPTAADPKLLKSIAAPPWSSTTTTTWRRASTTPTCR
jgi:dihydroxyacid dehydratase/phosphogluconate dehydratase